MKELVVEKELEKVIKTETVTVYKAFDGKEFSEMSDCREYELVNRFKKDKSLPFTRYIVNSADDFIDLICTLEYPCSISNIRLYVDASSTVHLNKFTYPMYIFLTGYYESDWGRNSMHMQTLPYMMKQAELELSAAEAKLATLKSMMQQSNS